MYLILMAWSLAVLSESLQALVDEFCIVGIDVETEQHQTSCSHSTNTVQEAKSFQDKVVVVLTVLLLPQVILWRVEVCV